MESIEHISDTAFLVNESRRRQNQISLDYLAEHWVPEDMRTRIVDLWDSFSREVYPFDDLELAIRNRFFLEQISSFFSETHDGVFINLGAGLTSYPYLLEREQTCIEVDLAHVVAFKQERKTLLEKQGTIPVRNISFFCANLNETASQTELFHSISLLLKGRPSFILLEGVSYYLQNPSFLALIKNLNALQTEGSIFAFDYWKPDMLTHPVFINLQNFFQQNFGYASQEYNLFDKRLFEKITGYNIQALTNVMEQEEIFAGTEKLADIRKILLENYAVLTRSHEEASQK